MKRFYVFLLSALLALSLTSCAKKGEKEDPMQPNRITFDGTTFTVTAAGYSHAASQTTFWLDFDQGNLTVTLSDSRIGSQVTLYRYGNSSIWWSLYFVDYPATIYSGNADGMGDITSGRVICTRSADSYYSLTFDVFLKDGKRLKGNHTGYFTSPGTN